MEKFQMTYQLYIMTNDKDVDELLMMWKKHCLGLILPDFSKVCWNDVEKIVICLRIEG